MPRRLTFTVTADYDGKKVAHFLRGSARFSARLVTLLKRQEDGIMLNGRPARTVDPIKEGDSLVLNLPADSALPEPKYYPLQILFEDEDVLVVNKPGTLAMHPSRKHQGVTLANAVARHLQNSQKESVFRAIGRLDKGTSGAVVCALNRFAAARLTGHVEKEYLALVHGEFSGEGTIDLPVYRPDAMKILRACGPEGEPALTRWSSLGCAGGMSLLSVRLETGRTHQIRVHFSHLGAPLAGDDMYGAPDTGLDRQMLHCCSAAFEHPVTGHRLTITAPLPPDMREFLAGLGLPKSEFPHPVVGYNAQEST